MSELDQRLLVRCSSEQLESWSRLAKAAEVPLAVWVRNALDDTAALQEVIRRDEARAERQARRLHELDPTVARRLLSDSVPEDAWPDPHTGGRER